MKADFTREEIFSSLKEYIKQEASNLVDINGVPTPLVIEALEAALDQLDKKTIRAKAAAEKRKFFGDELREAIEICLNEEYQTLDELTAAVADIDEFEGITNSQVSLRMGQLIDLGIAEKEKLKGGRRLTVYRLTEKYRNIT